MQRRHRAVAVSIAVGTLVGCLPLGNPTLATPVAQIDAQTPLPALQGAFPVPVPPKPPKAPPRSSQTRQAWIDRMVHCESGGDPHNVNEVDRDGTSSYGLLQFKPSTLRMYQARYGLTGELMDPAAQMAVFVRMMDDPRVVWSTEFPDCSARHGLPPAS